jgi:hypothetical protein
MTLPADCDTHTSEVRVRRDWHSHLVIGQPGFIADCDRAIVTSLNRSDASRRQLPKAVHNLCNLLNFLDISDSSPVGGIRKRPYVSRGIVDRDHFGRNHTPAVHSLYLNRICTIDQASMVNFDIEIARPNQPSTIRPYRQCLIWAAV